MVANVLTTHTAIDQGTFRRVDVTKVTREMDFLVQVNPNNGIIYCFSTATLLKGVLCRTIRVNVVDLLGAMVTVLGQPLTKIEKNGL